MHDSALVQKLDQIIQIGKRILQRSDHADRLLTKIAENQRELQISPGVQTPEPGEGSQGCTAPQTTSDTNITTSGLVEFLVAIVGVASAVCSFFPHVSVSDPGQMDATDLFSYQMTVTNGGVLPIFGVKWALAPRNIKIATISPSTRSVHMICPHFADWVATNELMALATKPGSKRDAVIMFYPGGELTVAGPADYEFQIRPTANKIGTLTPGDQFTFTTEGLMSAPPNAVYDTADFAVAIRYIPVFPPVPMQTCSHFHIFKDRLGTPHWFRETDQCDRFPWMHNWFFATRNQHGKP